MAEFNLAAMHDAIEHYMEKKCENYKTMLLNHWQMHDMISGDFLVCKYNRLGGYDVVELTVQIANGIAEVISEKLMKPL